MNEEPATPEGSWPPPLRRLANDFLPHAWAPPNDGVVKPLWDPPQWLQHVSTLTGALDTARHARESAEAAAKTAEDKGARLAQVSLVLVTAAIGLGSYELGFVFSRYWLWGFLLSPSVIAVVCLGLALFESLQVDRVGFYSQAEPSDLADTDANDLPVKLLAGEERGRFLARWTAIKKHSDLMQARAWFSRGLVALVVAGVIGGFMRADDQANAARGSPAAAQAVCRPGGSLVAPPRGISCQCWQALGPRSRPSSRLGLQFGCKEPAGRFPGAAKIGSEQQRAVAQLG